MPEPLIIEPKYKKIVVEIDGTKFNLNIREPSFTLIKKCIEENDCRRFASEWIFNSIDESQKEIINIEDIYKQDDSFFDKVFLEYVKDNEVLLSCYNNHRDDSEEVCERFINAFYDYGNEIAKKSISKIQEIISDTIKSYSITASSIVEAVNKAAESCKKIIQGINKMVSSLNETISKIKIPQISEVRKQELVEIYTQWGKYGWTSHPESSVFFFSFCPDSKAQADKYASKVCNKTNMNLLFEYLKKEKLVSKKDLTEAIVCYNNSCNKACAMLLLSMIERVLIKLQITDKKENILVGNGAIKYFEEKFNSGVDIKKTFFSFLEYTCLTSCLKEYFKKGKNFVVDTEVANRNQIDHGMYKKQVLKRDCTKLFLLLYNLIYFINVMEEKK